LGVFVRELSAIGIVIIELSRVGAVKTGQRNLTYMRMCNLSHARNLDQPKIMHGCLLNVFSLTTQQRPSTKSGTPIHTGSPGACHPHPSSFCALVTTNFLTRISLDLSALVSALTLSSSNLHIRLYEHICKPDFLNGDCQCMDEQTALWNVSAEYVVGFLDGFQGLDEFGSQVVIRKEMLVCLRSHPGAIGTRFSTCKRWKLCPIQEIEQALTIGMIRSCA